MHRFAPALLLIACGSPEPQVVAPDPGVLADGLTASQPGPLVELVDETSLWVEDLSGCPSMEELPTEDGLGTRQIWTGDCVRPDGAQVEGRLERYEEGDHAWLAGQGFAIRREGALELWIDGAIELSGQGDLMLLDAAASTCGGPGIPCAEALITVDLEFSIYPASSFPDRFDVNASGVVSLGGAPIALEGTWSVDVATCAMEPASGTIALRQGERHAIELDGASACDGCGAWVAGGVEVAPWCGVEL